MTETPPHQKVSTAAWILAYLISPAIPFVCLRIERAITTAHCIFGVLAALLAHVGLVSVLGKTNNQPLQIFIVLLLGVSIYLICAWQYLAGHLASLWSAKAERLWGLAARFFGSLIATGLAAAILTFHFQQP